MPCHAMPCHVTCYMLPTTLPTGHRHCPLASTKLAVVYLIIAVSHAPHFPKSTLPIINKRAITPMREEPSRMFIGCGAVLLFNATTANHHIAGANFGSYLISQNFFFLSSCHDLTVLHPIFVLVIESVPITESTVEDKAWIGNKTGDRISFIPCLALPYPTSLANADALSQLTIEHRELGDLETGPGPIRFRPPCPTQQAPVLLLCGVVFDPFSIHTYTLHLTSLNPEQEPPARGRQILDWTDPKGKSFICPRKGSARTGNKQARISSRGRGGL
ncbi:hypothetical protein CCHR01_09548 [Colletotrichum chrysophilum]|uniref:Uncharacterized protein n=1 Tax=Colletotrichum chrysophilum TaxID=1836956 RepID=A0AAD9AGR4_9PEZI|nr:hypothetical protein CCHR01_09548 [Colletotrichum chrysophilum]